MSHSIARQRKFQSKTETKPAALITMRTSSVVTLTLASLASLVSGSPLAPRQSEFTDYLFVYVRIFKGIDEILL